MKNSSMPLLGLVVREDFNPDFMCEHVSVPFPKVSHVSIDGVNLSKIYFSPPPAALSPTSSAK